MASIHKDIQVGAAPRDAWEAFRDYGAVHERLAPGFVADTELDGDDRIVRAREIITGAFHAGCWFASRPVWRRWASPARWMLMAALVSAWVVWRHV